MARIEMMIDGLRQSPASHQWVVVLKDKSEERYLPIWIGLSQAESMKRELTGVTTSGAVTCDFALTGANTTNSKLESVTIDRFENNTFYAKLSVIINDKIYEVDSPAPGALAIALRAKAPIFAEEAILNRTGVSIAT